MESRHPDDVQDSIRLERDANMLTKILLSFLVLALCIPLLSCASSSPIVGKWQNSTLDQTVEFTGDGKAILGSKGNFTAGTYQLVGDEIVSIKLNGLTGEIATAWQYKISGDKMEVTTAGDTTAFHRVDSFAKPTTSATITAPTVTSATSATTNPLPATSNPRPTSWAKPPAMAVDQNQTYTATIKTNYGDIVVQLFAKDAPLTVNNFVFLSRQGFYDNVRFHRVIKEFMIQTGDPTGTGAGGPGYQFADELPPKYQYEPGIVAMANAGPNTNGSQFFICTGAQSKNLNSYPNYTVFGKVIGGMDVVSKIAGVPVAKKYAGDPETSSPIEDVHIDGVSIQ